MQTARRGEGGNGGIDWWGASCASRYTRIIYAVDMWMKEERLAPLLAFFNRLTPKENTKNTLQNVKLR